LGKKFEEKIRDDLKQQTSDVYQALKAKIADLDQRAIFYQMYLCINGTTDCVKEKEYFIADFVFVKKMVDPEGNEYWDVIVADTKLSSSTDFTENQKAARSLSSYHLRTLGVEKIAGPDLGLGFITGTNITRNSDFDFIKIYSDGTGKFVGIK
jgi:hypothetical protein